MAGSRALAGPTVPPMSASEHPGRRRITHIRVRRRRREMPVLVAGIVVVLLALVAWILFVGLNGPPA
jgi:hypothetical protein